MRELRWVSAGLLLTSLVGSVGAQQSVSGAIPSAPPILAPSPAGPGGEPKAAVSDDPTDSVNWRDRVAAARHRHADWAACVAAKIPDCTETPAPDVMDALLNDETLVDGDIVATPNGFKVFRGQSTVPHSLTDFQ